MAKNETKDASISEDAKEEAPRSFGEKVWSEVKFLIGLFAFLIVFWTTVFGHYKIPSESMQPTLEVGDHLLWEGKFNK